MKYFCGQFTQFTLPTPSAILGAKIYQKELTPKVAEISNEKQFNACVVRTPEV